MARGEGATEDDLGFDPARHCGAARRSDDRPGPRMSHGQVVVSEGGGKGRPCRRTKGWGTSHPGYGPCKFHLGATPMHESAAAREAERSAATRALTMLGVAVTADPAQALLEQVWEAVGNVAFLRARVQGLGLEGLMSPTRSGDERIHPLVGLYAEERDRLARICKLALDAGIAERAIRVAEQQADVIVTLVTRGLDAVGLSGEQRQLAQQAVVAGLRELAEVDLRVAQESRN